ncbi:metal-dependent hydrolase [Dyella acidiphila]|uniref:Metal-dependent hydrolase n=1 Tax=Dyella acidiphila TaxID=2775866 RepID=A0ABR9GF61_9GAMM|nr:metal-dependent hydrolase [Dyella acidiphila]MBE1162685.1 metal-dependent hydrolase [Dyella acidiphila]
MTYDPRIVRRDLHFDMQADIPRYWLNGDAHQTRYFDALSLMFPDGERFFIDSVRAFRPDIAGDMQLDAAVGGFIGQEAMHSREHLLYNERLQRQGVDAQGLMQIVKDVQDQRARTLSAAGQLALTICLEHFTAMLADHLLRHPAGMRKADPRMAAIWRWHALEETEHKAVAFDVYQRVGGTPFIRWRRRCRAMLWVTMLFTYRTWQFMWRLSKTDGTQKDWRGWLRLLGFLFVSPAPITRIGGQWLRWFLPGFHPWKHDNRVLMEAARVDVEQRMQA